MDMCSREQYLANVRQECRQANRKQKTKRNEYLLTLIRLIRAHPPNLIARKNLGRIRGSMLHTTKGNAALQRSSHRQGANPAEWAISRRSAAPVRQPAASTVRSESRTQFAEAPCGCKPAATGYCSTFSVRNTN